MRVISMLAAVGFGFLAAAPASAYDTLKQDYAACVQGGGNISNSEVVAACTRLIDNSAKENELVGYFYAMRAANNTNKQQNCSDARKVLELVSDKTFIDGAKQLIDINC